MSLYHHESSLLGKESLDKVAQFLKGSILPSSEAKESDKRLAASLLLQLAAQRGYLRYLLDSVEHILHEEVRIQVPREQAAVIFQWICCTLVEETPSGALGPLEYCISTLEGDRKSVV